MAGDQGTGGGVRRAPAYVCLPLAFCGGLALGSSAHALASDERPGCGDDPARAALDFYRYLVVHGDSGLPSPEEMQGLSGYLSQRLTTAIESARVRQQALMGDHPDDKPPFIEGSLYTSAFEGATAIERAKVLANKAGQEARVRVYLRYDDDQADSKPFRWHDQLRLRCESGRWRVDDVMAEGTWGFGNHGSLRDGLESSEW